jgi:hypothetical protein
MWFQNNLMNKRNGLSEDKIRENKMVKKKHNPLIIKYPGKMQMQTKIQNLNIKVEKPRNVYNLSPSSKIKDIIKKGLSADKANVKFNRLKKLHIKNNNLYLYTKTDNSININQKTPIVKHKIINSELNTKISLLTPNKTPNKNDKNNNIKKINYIDEAVHREIDKIENNPWRGAEAYHYLMLCQKQLHQKKYKEACKTALRLKFYEDILSTETTYKLIAICSYMNKCYKFFADALIILSNEEKINKRIRLELKNFAQEFFIKNKNENIGERFYKCSNPYCNEAISEYDTYCNVCGFVLFGCVLSGRSILDNKYFKCKQCRNKTIKIEVKKKQFKHCPLCHVTLFDRRKEQ